MKKWYKSKTLWIGFLQVVAGISVYASTFFTEHKDLDVSAWLLLINGIIMVVLRQLTSTALMWTQPKSE